MLVDLSSATPSQWKWNSCVNYFAINPRIPQETRQVLYEVLERVSGSFRNHLFLLTSGTTSGGGLNGLKWVALSQEGFLDGARGVNSHLKLGSDDVWIHTLPSFHVGGIAIWARAYVGRSRVVQLGRWDPATFCASITENRGTVSAVVPAQIFDLVRAGARAPVSLRALICGGGAIGPGLLRDAGALGWPVVPAYGMTEASSQIATAVPGGSDLRVLSHLEIRFVDGRIAVKGSAVCSAYLKFVNGRLEMVDPKQDGWFVSEDRGVLENGSLRVLGRSEDWFKIGGESVELQNLSNILEEIRVRRRIGADVALLPVPDPRLGHVIHLVSDDGLGEAEAEDLRAEFSARVQPFERIRNWHRLGSLPRTALGKLVTQEVLRRIR